MKNKITFIAAGAVILLAVVFLIITNTESESHFFITVGEMAALSPEERTKPLVVSGAVIGDSISYDEMVPQVEFTIVDIPGDLKLIEEQGGLAAVLHAAVADESAQRLTVVFKGVKPDLLENEAQVIAEGKLGEDNRFYANDLLMKCPSRYAEDLPKQIEE